MSWHCGMVKKIGEQFEVKKDIELKSSISDEVVKVCKGDIGVVRSNGSLVYINGQAKGITTPRITDTIGYDTESMTEIIMKQVYQTLISYFDDEEIKDIICSLKFDIWGALDDILI